VATPHGRLPAERRYETYLLLILSILEFSISAEPYAGGRGKTFPSARSHGSIPSIPTCQGGRRVRRRPPAEITRSAAEPCRIRKRGDGTPAVSMVKPTRRSTDESFQLLPGPCRPAPSRSHPAPPAPSASRGWPGEASRRPTEAVRPRAGPRARTPG